MLGLKKIYCGLELKDRCIISQYDRFVLENITKDLILDDSKKKV